MQSLKALSPTTKLAALLLLGLTGFLVFDQQPWWDLREEYMFGYIVPLFAAYILYDRWPRIASVLVKPATTPDGQAEKKAAPGVTPSEDVPADTIYAKVGDYLNQRRWPDILFKVLAGAAILFGVLFFLLGALYRAMEGRNLVTSNALTIGYTALLLATVYLFSDRRADGVENPVSKRVYLVALFIFPAFIWWLSVPMVNALYQTVSTFLMSKVAVTVFFIMDLLGFAVLREGSVLKLPGGEVGVEDACSGIRSLMACLFAGSFLGAAFFRTHQVFKKIFMVVTAMFFAFLNNIFRSLFLTSWAYAHGPEALDMHVVLLGIDMGNVHDFTGWVVLVLTVVFLLVIVKIFTFEFETTEPPGGATGQAASASS